MPLDLQERTRLEELHPGALAAADDLDAAAWAAVDPELLGLCLTRVTQMLDVRPPRVPVALDPAKVAALPEFDRSDRFSPLERAALAFTEQFVVSVDAMSDADVQPLVAELGASGTWTFVSALCTVELIARLDAVTHATLAPGEDSAA